jgi:putative pyruvate formate lyase activating enzyme
MLELQAGGCHNINFVTPEHVVPQILEALVPVGSLEIGPDGLARRGVLIRHLVMPGAFEETEAILEWLASELGPGTYVNLMDQYRPAGKVDGRHHPELNRRPARNEYRRAVELAEALSLRLDRRPAGLEVSAAQ